MSGAAVMLVAGAACGANGDDLPELPDPPPTEVSDPSPTPGLNLAPEEQAALDEALEVFDAYIETYTRLAIEGTDIADGAHYAELGQYGIADPDGYDSLELDNYQARGHLGSGAIEWELLDVLEVDADGSDDPREEGRPRVRLQACIDETDWTVVDRDSGEVVEGPGGREVATVLLVYVSEEYDTIRPEDAWRVGLWEHEEAESC